MSARAFDHTKLRDLRDSRGLSRDALAHSAGITVDGLVKLEQGRRTPRGDTLAQLADALSCQIDDFYRVSKR